MADKLTIQNSKVTITTEEGQKFERAESELVEMCRQEFVSPLGGEMLPDGVKLLRWQRPCMLVIHQLAPHIRRFRWITDDSPSDFGPGTTYREVRLSIPYAITFALFYRRGKQLFLTGSNELYFRNEPLRSESDALYFPALLNISQIPAPRRTRSWICTQHLQQSPGMSWTAQLEALLDHTFNGAFNRSSERHEGASGYGASKGVHESLHPVERWEEATAKNEMFALTVPWKPAKITAGELAECMLAEASGAAGISRAAPKNVSGSLVGRFLNYIQNGRA